MFSCLGYFSCKFGQLGPGKGQFNSPHGFCLGLEEEIIVADTNNHRIQVFEKNGTYRYQFGVAGKGSPARSGGEGGRAALVSEVSPESGFVAAVKLSFFTGKLPS